MKKVRYRSNRQSWSTPQTLHSSCHLSTELTRGAFETPTACSRRREEAGLRKLLASPPACIGGYESEKCFLPNGRKAGFGSELRVSAKARSFIRHTEKPNLFCKTNHDPKNSYENDSKQTEP